MYDRTTVLHLVNDAYRRTPACACGSSMATVEHDGALWLECRTQRAPGRSRLARLRSLDFLIGHDRELILGRDELAAA
jgi:hypothetical protein